MRKTRKKLDKIIKKIDPDTDASIAVINEHLQKPPEWLSRSVRDYFPYSYTAKACTQYFAYLDDFKESKEDYTRSEIVSINPEYFNKSLSNDVPQLIVVELVKAGYWYMYQLSDKVKQPGAFKLLEDMVNPGK